VEPESVFFGKTASCRDTYWLSSLLLDVDTLGNKQHRDAILRGAYLYVYAKAWCADEPREVWAGRADMMLGGETPAALDGMRVHVLRRKICMVPLSTLSAKVYFAGRAFSVLRAAREREEEYTVTVGLLGLRLERPEEC
jgi:hypothetical protein